MAKVPIEVPIACTLRAGELPDRVDEWRRFLGTAVLDVEHHPGATAARLRLPPGDDVLLAAADLSRRERACCAFFRFRLEPAPDALWLEIEVPPDAAPVLAGLLALAAPA